MSSVDDILELNLVSATPSSLVHQLAPQQVTTPNSGSLPWSISKRSPINIPVAIDALNKAYNCKRGKRGNPKNETDENLQKELNSAWLQDETVREF